jgi:hypothetical protein
MDCEKHAKYWSKFPSDADWNILWTQASGDSSGWTDALVPDFHRTIAINAAIVKRPATIRFTS